MAKLKFTIHPLFFVFGVYFAFTGRVFVFLTYTLVAVIHEMGHSIAAAKMGYRLNRIVLMPYGAMVSGDLSGLKLRDEIEVALAGPMLNFACALFFVALWWVFPETYAFTDTAMIASVSIATINLLPCRPLDGGRVLHSLLCLNFKKKTADIVLMVSGIVFSCVLGGLFILSCFYDVNLSLLFFSLFAFFGTVFTHKRNRYVKLFDNSYLKLLKRGAEIKRVAVSSNVTVKHMISFLSNEYLTEVHVYNDEGEKIKTIYPKDMCEILSGETLYKKLSEIENFSFET